MIPLHHVPMFERGKLHTYLFQPPPTRKAVPATASVPPRPRGTDLGPMCPRAVTVANGSATQTLPRSTSVPRSSSAHSRRRHRAPIKRAMRPKACVLRCAPGVSLAKRALQAFRLCSWRAPAFGPLHPSPIPAGLEPGAGRSPAPHRSCASTPCLTTARLPNQRIPPHRSCCALLLAPRPACCTGPSGPRPFH